MSWISTHEAFIENMQFNNFSQATNIKNHSYDHTNDYT